MSKTNYDGPYPDNTNEDKLNLDNPLVLIPKSELTRLREELRQAWEQLEQTCNKLVREVARNTELTQQLAEARVSLLAEIRGKMHRENCTPEWFEILESDWQAIEKGE